MDSASSNNWIVRKAGFDASKYLIIFPRVLRYNGLLFYLSTMAHILLKQPSLLCSLPFQTLSKVSIQYFSPKKTFTGDKWHCIAGNLRTQRTVFLTIVCINDVPNSKFSPLENLLIKCQPLHPPPLSSRKHRPWGALCLRRPCSCLKWVLLTHITKTSQPWRFFFPFDRQLLELEMEEKNLNRMASDMKSERFLPSCASLCHTHLSVGTLSD